MSERMTCMGFNVLNCFTYLFIDRLYGLNMWYVQPFLMNFKRMMNNQTVTEKLFGPLS